MHSTLKKDFFDLLPQVDFASIRWENHLFQEITLRSGELLPVNHRANEGVFITIINKGGYGYGATCDLTPEGLRQAIDNAMRWSQLTSDKYILNFSKLNIPQVSSRYKGPVRQPWQEVALKDKIEYLKIVSAGVTGPDIVDYQTTLWHHKVDKEIHATNGSEQIIEQEFILPMLSVTAAKGTEAQTRTFAGHAYTVQGGFESFANLNFSKSAAAQVTEEARELLAAPNCPNKTTDLLIASDQMVLQIHESIGHPLELDRILGDERNFAGTSFVTLDMFGSYRYGSDLLNITFDPTIDMQVASYNVDDDGLKAEKAFIIEKGMLKRPLGGGISQQRAGGIDGVANSRSTLWSRPPIDRMANLNLEPGQSSFQDMLNQIEDGVYVQTNCSWSIDDSRNKFQFGCERAQLIENGKLTKVVKNSGYRGISASFWRSLKAVGNRDTFEVLGTPYCGKGEPNQVIHVGHATPPCLFANIEVFGGE